jgi:succinyl-diaminopimelate desuccinylase
MAGALTGATPGVRCAPFFTDAGSVRAVFPDLPLLILGPGDPSLAHATDECCPVEQIRMARQLYGAILSHWYGAPAHL